MAALACWAPTQIYVLTDPVQFTEVPLVEWLIRVRDLDIRPYVKPTTVLAVAWAAFVIALLARAPGRAWLVSRVPAITPQVLGVYRLVVAAGLATVVLLAHLPSPWFRLACLIPVAAFAAGLWPRVGGGLWPRIGTALWPRVSLAVPLVLLASALGMDFADHDYFAPVQAWLLLLFVPWGESGLSWSSTSPAARIAASATAGNIANNTEPRASRRYGVALVIVPLVLGTAYVAAAFAKLDSSVRAWLLDGAVRYHIAQDGPDAPGNLWRIVASQDWLTVPMGPAVIVLEAVVIAAVLAPSTRVRIAAGMAAVLLHLGFGLLQGVWWEAWWVLLPAFLPWPWIVDRLWPVSTPSPVEPATRSVDALPWGMAVALALLLVQQPVVSLLRIERKPFVSNFPMYSNVRWSSKAEYAAHMDRWKKPEGRAVRLVTSGGAEDAVALDADLGQVAACAPPLDEADRLANGGEPASAGRAAFDRCAEAFRRVRGTPVPPLTVQASDRHFSWDAVDFVPTGKWTTVGTLGAATP